MGDHVALPAASATEADPENDLQFLRSILVGPAERQLHALQSRMDDRFAHAREVGAVLPQAVLSRADDPEFARALRAPVEHAITAAVRENPQPLADAIFPIIGPAIRRAVAASLAAMLDSFNRTLEYSVSRRALRWRVEAIRTGRPFGEVVLLHTLLYRVEQVFLIQRQSGLLLAHVRAGGARVQDAQMVSGMLTAIRDFVQDSFRVSENESLDRLQVGDLQVWVEQGPSAIMAMVVRGTAPPAVRQTLQRAVETIHLQFAEALARFAGDTEPFDAARPVLDECLQAEYRAPQGRPARRAWLLAAAVLLAAGIWMAFEVRDRMRWAAYLEALRDEPGIVVVSSERRGGRYSVAGLRDPLAREPGALLPQSRLRDEVSGRWEPYQALVPSFILARAQRALAPPPGVTLSFDDGVLRADGPATAEWIEDARRIAPLVGGVSSLDVTGLIASSLTALVRRIEGRVLVFGRGSTALVDGQAGDVHALVADLRELDALGALAGRTFTIELRGHADTDGPAVSNVPLSRARAERAAAALALGTTPQLGVVVSAAGSGEPLAAGHTDADKQRNRRVTLHVADASAGAGIPR